MSAADQSGPVARTPEEAFHAIRALIENPDATLYRDGEQGVYVDELQQVLDSVRPVAAQTIDRNALQSARRRIAVLYMAGSGGEAATFDLRLAVDELDAVLASAPTPAENPEREAIARLLHERCSPPWMDHWDDLEPEVREDSEWWVIADAVLALVQPVDGVLLTREEAALAAWALRHAKGWPEVTTQAALDHLHRRTVLRQRLEAKS